MSGFDQRRFRMNLIVRDSDPEAANGWVGHKLGLGDGVAAEGGATGSPMCNDDACSGRSTPGYGCSRTLVRHK